MACDVHPKFRDKRPAPIQITVEQIVREAREKDLKKVGSAVLPTPHQKKSAKIISTKSEQFMSLVFVEGGN